MRSIYCVSVFRQRVTDAGVLQSGVKIKRYVRALNEFIRVGEIKLGHRKYFAVTVHENKVYVFGGEIDYVAQKSVSFFQ